MKLYFTLANLLLFLSINFAQSPQLDPSNSCDVTSSLGSLFYNDWIYAQDISADKYRFNISYGSYTVQHMRGKDFRRTTPHKINHQLTSTDPLKNKINSYFGREYSITVDASFDNGSTWTNGSQVCTWSSPKFRITYNLNGGSNSGSSLTLDELKESGDFLNDGATLTKTGFVFAGWNTASDGSGTNYPIVSSNIPFTPPSGMNDERNHTLYAVWISNANTNTYTISYDDNVSDGGFAPSDQTKTHGVDITLASNTGNLIRTGFNFDGWNDAADGNGTDFAESATYSTDANLTLYAKWTAITLNISQDLIGSQGDFIDDGQNGNGSISYTVGEPIIFTINDQITQGFQQPNDVNNSSIVLNEISSKPILKSPLNNQNATNLFSSVDLNVKIYPNPSDGKKIMIEAIGFDHSIGKYKIKIFDVSSKLIDEFTHESNDYLFIEINFSKQLVNGFYFMNIRKGEDQIIKKFIVK